MDFEPTGTGAGITPELATSNPDQFRDLTLQLLRTESVHGGALFDLLQEQGLASPKFELDTTGWVSRSEEGSKIVLGTKPLSPHTKHELIFEDRRFGYGSEMALKLLHELSHKFAFYVDPRNSRFNRFRNNLVSQREGSPKMGLSTLGNLDFYITKGPLHQSTEDITELLKMYSSDPAYLRRFLDFLSSPSSRDARQQMGLSSLSAESSNNVYEIISGTIENELQR